MRLALVALFVVLARVGAQVPNLGGCPEYLPMMDFDVDRFLGKWYEAERYFSIAEVGSRCVETEYAKGPSGKIYVTNKISNSITGLKRVIDGHIETVTKGGEGKMNVRYTSLPLPYDTSYTILETDYDNYAVMWSCSGIFPVHTENAWVMTRERLAPVSVLQRAYGVLDKYKLNRAFFLKTDQERCAISAADLIATAAKEAAAAGIDDEQDRSAGVVPVKVEEVKKPVEPVAVAADPVVEHVLGKEGVKVVSEVVGEKVQAEIKKDEEKKV